MCNWKQATSHDTPLQQSIQTGGAQMNPLDVGSHESGIRVSLEVVSDRKRAGLASHYGAFRAPAYCLVT